MLEKSCRLRAEVVAARAILEQTLPSYPTLVLHAQASEKKGAEGAGIPHFFQVCSGVHRLKKVGGSM